MSGIKNEEVTTDLLYKDEVYAVVGAAMEVHTSLGYGFLESVYQEAFEMELNARGIPFTAQSSIPIRYKEHLLTKQFIADLVVFGKIIVELKAANRLDSSHDAQVINYLKASGYSVGLLLNFGSQSLQWKRLVFTQPLNTNRHFANS
jgi:GxxExxY protein